MTLPAGPVKGLQDAHAGGSDLAADFGDQRPEFAAVEPEIAQGVRIELAQGEVGLPGFGLPPPCGAALAQQFGEGLQRPPGRWPGQ